MKRVKVKKLLSIVLALALLLGLLPGAALACDDCAAEALGVPPFPTGAFDHGVGTVWSQQMTNPQNADILLFNGYIHTMDDADTVVSWLWIEDGQIGGVSNTPVEPGPGTQVIDLDGRTVIPGLIDNHIHLIRVMRLPGYDIRRLETAFTFADAQQVIEEEIARLTACGRDPSDIFLTALGGVRPGQFVDNQTSGLPPGQWEFPSLALLDAAAPDTPVYMSNTN
ncbi:MAG: amidohydrolase family protein, partial [Oscillospiraceae bacterium]|nr:amidohydrolase family protein [Oscillospiraceae bacterium]